MAVELSRRLFSVDEYHRMIEAGVLGPDDRLELLEGEIVEMNPIGSRHAACVNRLNVLLNRLLAERAIVAIQNPVAIGGLSELQPDVSVLRPRDDFYAADHPSPDDVQLIIEVADTSIEYDRRIKIPLYAKAGVPEVWLVDLEQGTVDFLAAPLHGAFTTSAVLRGNDRIPSRALGEHSLRVTDILPPYSSRSA